MIRSVFPARSPTLALILAAMHGPMPSAVAAPTDFTVMSGEKKFNLADARGKYVALHFLLKTECPYCLRHVQQYAAESPKVAGVMHVFLKPDADEDIKAFAAKLPKSDSPPVTIFRDPDGKLANEFKIPDGYAFHGLKTHYPALILLGPDGTEAFRYVGKNNADRLSFEKFAAKVAELTRAPGLSHYNVKEGQPAIEGHDPVAYHESGSAMKGRGGIAAAYRGVTYHFATPANRQRFAENPERFVPAYGGWCATAMAEGDKVEIDPANFKVSEGRLLLFYKGWLGDAKKEWNKNEPDFTRKADENWGKLVPSERPERKGA
mgnify:CR=1 FL=1